MTAIASTYTNYQLSAIGVGAIATGLDDIRQCIDFILRTVPGSDPLRPPFGSNVYRYIDAPVNTMIPNMKKEIFEALDLWEPRIKVVSIKHEISLGQVLFEIAYQVTDSSILDSLTWSVSGIVQVNESASGVIMSAAIPVHVEFGRYNVSFVVDGKAVYPPTPSYGFSSVNEMINWITSNWFPYGQWFATDSKLVLYMKSGMATKAALIVTQTASITVKTFMRGLTPGQFFNIDFTVDGLTGVPAYPLDTINNIEQLLNWLQDYWTAYGSWWIENNGAIITAGDFSDEFSHDFSTGGVEVDRYLVFQTDKHFTATLNFI